MRPSKRRELAIIVTVVLVMTVSMVFVAWSVAASHEENETKDAFTVEPEDRSPGATGNTVYWEVADREAFEDAGAPIGFEYTDYIWFHTGEFMFDCDLSDAGPTVLVRDGGLKGADQDDETGTLQYIDDFDMTDETLWSVYYEGDELSAPQESYEGGPGHGEGNGREDGDGNLDWYADDLWHTTINNCVENPDEPGWYHWQWYMNGTNADGYEEGQEISQEESQQGEYVEIEKQSEPVWICDCEDEEEAREKLGPPPGEEGSEETPTAADPEETPTEAGDDGAGDDGAGDDGTGDDGTGDDGAGDDGTGDDGAGDDGTGDDGTGDDGTGDDGTGDDGTGDDEDGTPGDGPGFGLVATILALLAIALLTYRRR